MDEQNSNKPVTPAASTETDAEEQAAAASAAPGHPEAPNPSGQPGEVPRSASSEEQTGSPGFGQPVQLPPGYTVDPATGQAVFVGQGQPVQYVQYIPVQPGMAYGPPQPSPEQIAAQQAAAQQRQGIIMQSMQSFIEGEATVSDVVKTLYTTTAQDDQLWKGILVGAAAAVLLTSDSVRNTMGKTVGAVFPGGKSTTAAAHNESAGDESSAPKQTTDKE